MELAKSYENLKSDVEETNEERVDKLMSEEFDKHYNSFEEFKKDFCKKIDKALKEIEEANVDLLMNFVQKWRRNIIYTNKYEIIQTHSFEQELDFIYNYIRFNLKEPTTAIRLYDNVIFKILSLQYFPERCPKIPTYKNNNIRKLLINNYIIIYEVNSNTRSSFYSTYFS